MTEEINPFQASPIEAGRHEHERSFVHPYASGQTRARWTILLTALSALLNVAFVASSSLQIQLLHTSMRSSRPNAQSLIWNDLRQTVIVRAEIVVSVAAFVAFLMWMYRAYGNLPALGAERLRFSAGWAVGYFFIPILSFFRPYQAAREIWMGSDPGRLPGSDRAVSPPTTVGWWWAAWLLSGIFGGLVAAMAGEARSARELVDATWWLIYGEIVAVVAALLLIRMVRAIDKNQTARHNLLQAASQDD
ncbi:MAG: DUF4328 domain-containing protein [Planctomycetota bacterium]|nr:MAG: DUF4328 domain-containing protein [Planctomycetota bacterium]REK49423.1 MAG: DUF4328 domain-containing protein [Planctomycetota bacterium]